jgi:hypothetical protein
MGVGGGGGWGGWFYAYVCIFYVSLTVNTPVDPYLGISYENSSLRIFTVPLSVKLKKTFHIWLNSYFER